MKKVFILFTLAAFAFSSCNKEEFQSDSLNEAPPFKSSSYIDDILLEFSAYGVVWHETNPIDAQYQDVLDNGYAELFILEQQYQDANPVEIYYYPYGYDNLPPVYQMSNEYSLLKVVGDNDDMEYVYCPSAGTNCELGSVNGAPLYMLKKEPVAP